MTSIHELKGAQTTRNAKEYISISDGLPEMLATEHDPLDVEIAIREHFRKFKEEEIENPVLHLLAGQKMKRSSHVALRSYRVSIHLLSKFEEEMGPLRLTSTSLSVLQQKIEEREHDNRYFRHNLVPMTNKVGSKVEKHARLKLLQRELD